MLRMHLTGCQNRAYTCGRGMMTVRRRRLLVLGMLAVAGAILTAGASAQSTFKALQSKAQAGDARAQFNLGFLYYHGQGVALDHAQAAHWYNKAAEQGLAEAQVNLGHLYAHGEGIPQDYAQAAVWWHKAAEQGSAEAQYNLGFIYAHGQGVPQDNVQAAIWWRKAADQGYAQGQFDLGRLYDKGEGVPQDFALAAVLYRKAADQGLAGAQFFLGTLNSLGQGVPQNFVEAYFWLDLAAAGNLNTEGLKQEDAIEVRDQTAVFLTPSQLSQVQARASKWFVAHPVSK